MKQSDYSELKLEWDRLQKDEQGLNKEFTIKSNTFASLQKQLSESAAQQKKLAVYITESTRLISKNIKKRQDAQQEVRKLRCEYEQLKERQRELQKNIADLTEGKEVALNLGQEQQLVEL